MQPVWVGLALDLGAVAYAKYKAEEAEEERKIEERKIEERRREEERIRVEKRADKEHEKKLRKIKFAFPYSSRQMINRDFDELA